MVPRCFATIGLIFKTLKKSKKVDEHGGGRRRAGRSVPVPLARAACFRAAALERGV
eukprot:gene8470-17811_t